MKLNKIISLVLIGCKKDPIDNDIVDQIDNTETISPAEELKIEINDFIWEGLNYWYYWQESVPDLSDSKTSNTTDYLNFLSNKEPEPFFVNPPKPDITPPKLPMELLFNVRVLPDEIEMLPLPDNTANSELLLTL